MPKIRCLVMSEPRCVHPCVRKASQAPGRGLHITLIQVSATGKSDITGRSGKKEDFLHRTAVVRILAAMHAWSRHRRSGH
jgi:hypothetical protein